MQRVGDGERQAELHQVLSPDDRARELRLNLVHDPLTHAGLVDGRQQVSQDQHLHARPLGQRRVVPVVAAGGTILRRRLRAAEVVVHVDEHVAAAGQRHQFLARPAVAGVADGPLVGIEAKGEALEEGLHVRRVAHGDPPAGPLDDVAGPHFPDPRIRPQAWQGSAAARKDVEAAPMPDAGADVWPVHTVVSEQQRG